MKLEEGRPTSPLAVAARNGSRSKRFSGAADAQGVAWDDADRVLLIFVGFVGAAAEFALDRAMDWLFVTSSLPNDLAGRLSRGPVPLSR